ncbi:hypothetical protein HZC30_07380 [Candidatus Woesearchaeota archaeon]|nr:hypothetical protein [Candidatus Woesearchaeota archaeon]
MESNKFDTKNLWYIIPGTIFLFPFTNLNQLSILSGIILIIIAYAIGFILHRTYRLIYHITLLYDRPAIKHLQKKLKNITKKEAEYIYNILIYCKDEHEEEISKIKKQSFHCSSLFSCFLAVIFSAVIMVYTLIRTIPIATHFELIPIYFLIACILLLDWFFLFKWMNYNEKMLVNKIIYASKNQLSSNQNDGFWFNKDGLKILCDGVIKDYVVV